MTHFYLTLPSNSSYNYFPHNTLANFKTKLHKDVALQGNWEVGLSEIIFPRNWVNVPSDQYIKILYKGCGSFDVPGNGVVKVCGKTIYSENIIIKRGHYNTLRKLIEEINTSIKLKTSEYVYKTWLQSSKHEAEWPILQFFQENNKVCIQLPEHTILQLPHLLAKLLAFDDPTLVNSGKEQRSLHASSSDCSSISEDSKCLFIYCDILEKIPVGDTLSPLLRILSVDVSGDGDSVHKIYEKPLYVPIQKKHFDCVEIDIRDTFGKKFPFEPGTLIVTLHFRQAKETYFV